MKLFSAFVAVYLLVASATPSDAGTRTDDRDSGFLQAGVDSSSNYKQGVVKPIDQTDASSTDSPAQTNPGQTNSGYSDPAESTNGSQEQGLPALKGKCTLAGDYVNDTDVIKFKGTTTFGTKLWSGPLVMVKGNNLTVTGPVTEGASFTRGGYKHRRR
ncbi:hypothetical protein PF008_g20054 [Phytophthora fragariae]|uniref:RxLR effector protein n=1 Tax=Phytophthora fragariae TaxID=53985 RepID=A0A6G0R0R3_9STRA|nr:hypothetical protein PF008_g20054 [Phytophthora fragariae]